MRYFIGVDLGQASDFTAISVLKSDEEAGTGQIIHLERLQLGMSYPLQVKRISALCDDLKRFNTPVFLITDATGVGRPVIDLLREAGLEPAALTITSGNSVNQDGFNFTVPKRDLISAMIVSLQSGTLKIIQSLPDSEVLIKELSNFKMKINIKTGNDSYEALREGDHDDLVLSVSMVVWFSSWLAGQYETTETIYYDDSYERRISSY